MTWSQAELEQEAHDRKTGITRTVSVNRKALEAQRRKRLAEVRAELRRARRRKRGS